VRRALLILFVIAELPLASIHAAPTDPRVCWSGEWWQPEPGGECRFTFYLRLSGASGPVRGRFRWRLVHCPNLAGRVGDSGYENVAGRIDGGRMRLRGSSVSDSTLLATDVYNLVIEGDALRGSTRTNENDWNGRIVARRVPCGGRPPPR
jgi:hypothetical protein